MTWKNLGLFILALLVLCAALVWYSYRAIDSLTEVLSFGG